MDEHVDSAKPAGLKDLLKNHNFRLSGWEIVSDFGDSLTMLALLILVNQVTGSAAAIATMMIVLAVPQVTVGLVAGVYVDRLDRKLIMIISDLLRGSLVLGFVGVALLGSADYLGDVCHSVPAGHHRHPLQPCSHCPASQYHPRDGSARPTRFLRPAG